MKIQLIALLSAAILPAGSAFCQSNTNSKAAGLPATNRSTRPQGKFILKGAGCAGFNFVGQGKVIWTNEMACSPNELSIFWLDEKTFVTKDILRTNEESPPRIDIYIVDQFDGKRLVLRSLWTGWGNYRFDTLEFFKSRKR
jgi:hypothetical protein